MSFEIIENKERDKIEKFLKERFGIQKISGKLLKSGSERIFLYLGDLSNDMLKGFEKEIKIERIGIYFAKYIKNSDEIKLSIEGCYILKDQIKKNIIDLDKDQMLGWMHGRDLLIKTNKKGFVVLKYENDLLGCGKASEEKITNFVPKNRRLKEKSS